MIGITGHSSLSVVSGHGAWAVAIAPSHRRVRARAGEPPRFLHRNATRHGPPSEARRYAGGMIAQPDPPRRPAPRSVRPGIGRRSRRPCPSSPPGLAYGVVGYMRAAGQRRDHHRMFHLAPAARRRAAGPCIDDVCNYLLLGSDSRAGLTARSRRSSGPTSDIGGSNRADTIMLVHTDPRLAEGDRPVVPARPLGRHPRARPTRSTPRSKAA